MSNTSISASKWSILLHYMKQWYHTHDLVLPLPFGSVMKELILSFSESKLQENPEIFTLMLLGEPFSTQDSLLLCYYQYEHAVWQQERLSGQKTSSWQENLSCVPVTQSNLTDTSVR